MLRTVKRGAVPLPCCPAATLFTVPSSSADAAAADVAAASAHGGSGSSPRLWATQLQFDDDGAPWSVAMFQSIKAKGVDEAEFNTPWSTIEPTEGTFDFGELDRELANAAAAGVKIVPIFWQSGWGGSPASWIKTTLSDGGICAPVHLASAALDQWNVVPGAVPAGTPIPASCPDTGGGPATVTGTAGVSGGGIEFLDIGATGLGGDGNLYSVTQGGQAACETWPNTLTGVTPANVYLQIDPSSQVCTASAVTIAVTYWSVAGQGFTVQYDAPGNAYLNGPTVTGSGTGSWQTATVTLTNPQFAEAQNLSADLRLAVTTPSQPLYVSSVTMSVAGS